MKRMVKNIRNDNNTNAAIDIMLSLEDIQDSACVGCFWYDPNASELFGVSSVIASSIPFVHSTQFNADVRTGGKLHRSIWQKEFHKGKDSRFKGNYTLVPRGRVFEFKNEGFRVYVGDWIDEYPESRQLIIDEFDLPENTEFIKDTHWDIGHGWSEDYL